MQSPTFDPPKLIRAYPLFFTPVMVFEVPDSAPLNERLFEFCQQARRKSEGMTRNVSMRHGWHSETDFFLQTEPECQRVQRSILRGVFEAAKQVWPTVDLSDYGVQCTGWINISPKGAFNTPHEHPNYQWAAVYYVNAPKTAGRFGGVIEFLDPRVNANSTQSNQLRFDTKHQIIPRPGTLIIFPCFLSHWVSPNEWDEDRISIACNVRLVPPAGDPNMCRFEGRDLLGTPVTSPSSVQPEPALA
jgi:uncharacterized protein (TIGR02466 family)